MRSEYILFIQDIKKKETTVVDSWRGNQDRQTYSYNVMENDTALSFTWAFQKKVSSLWFLLFENCMLEFFEWQSLETTNLLSIGKLHFMLCWCEQSASDRAGIFLVNATNVIGSPADSCTPCAAANVQGRWIACHQTDEDVVANMKVATKPSNLWFANFDFLWKYSQSSKPTLTTTRSWHQLSWWHENEWNICILFV